MPVMKPAKCPIHTSSQGETLDFFGRKLPACGKFSNKNLRGVAIKTIDGRNPKQLPDMYETRQIMGYLQLSTG